MRVVVLTISDRAFRGEYADRSGPEIERVLREEGVEAQCEREVVPDEAPQIRAALERLADSPAPETPAPDSPPPELGAPDFIITTGGTGLAPRDVTPEVTRAFCERELPGISETIRRESMAETATAMLSRGYAGVRGSTIVVNVPGSVRGASLAVRVIAPIMAHARAMLRGEGH
ncbi:MAG: MogA/MoaB family molybdenum cofactor biosynthesis protein [Spirochaetota bacterium]